jgi:kynureninase
VHPRSQQDPLANYRDRFVGSDSSLIYFDGNSLGRPLKATLKSTQDFIAEQWGGRLIRGWDEQWFELPLTLGDDLARIILGAGPGQTAIGDSTTVWLYKLIRAAVDFQLLQDPARNTIVIGADDFPTDRYLVEGIAAERQLHIRWVKTEPQLGLTPQLLTEALDETVALVVYSHVSYRSAYLGDLSLVTALAHKVGALLLADLCHSAGVIPMSLDAAQVDLAVGCSYKFLNGGPGSPAFGYVAHRHQGLLKQPIQGWMGHADPFVMGPGYTPAVGIRSFLSGTPPISGMVALADMIALINEVGLEQIRKKSIDLTEFVLVLGDKMLAPWGVAVASPRDSSLRGSHVTFTHPQMQEVTARLWQREVIPDYRNPSGLRVGLSPLSTSFAEVERGLAVISDVFQSLSS